MSDYFKKVQLDEKGKEYAFFFDTLKDIQSFSNETIENYSSNRPNYNVVSEYKMANLPKLAIKFRNNLSGEWYGTTNTDWAGQEITSFLYIDKLDSDLKTISTSLNGIKLKDITQKKRISFTEREIGIFSFDLASLGLVRVYQYYSPVTKGIVDPYLIDSYNNENGDLIFFYVGTPYIPRHEVFFSLKEGCYVSPILGRKVEVSELEEVLPVNSGDQITFFYPEQVEIPRHDVERRQVVNEDGQKKFSSTYKKSFIYLPKVKNKLPRIDLLVPIGYAGSVESKSMYYNALCIVAIVEKLMDLKINFRLIASRGIEDVKMTKKVYNFVNLKNDNQTIDRNTISTLISDARYYRTVFFKTSLAAQIEVGLEASLSKEIGYPITDENLIKSAYMNYLSKQSNPSDLEASKNRATKIIIPRSLSEYDVVENFEKVLRQVESQIII